MKQGNLFGQEFAPSSEGKYTSKIKAPVYEPKNKKPHILELYDNSKTKRLIQQINNADISEDDKLFLKHAAQRHTIFNYNKIADYYAHSSKEVQELFEHSALVIIDFEKAIQYAYAKLSDEVVQTYIKDTGNDI
jgi:hypothetical protein